LKIPKELLMGSMDELMTGDLKETFKKIGYGGIPEWTNTGCAFFCYMDDRTCRQVKSAVHDVKLEYYEIDNCVLIRFNVVVYDRLDNPLRFDAFINMGNKNHNYMLDALMVQEWLIFHWYGEDFIYKRSTGIRWKEENRNWVKEIVRRGRECIEKNRRDGVRIDFDRVKDKFMRENPLG